MKAMLRQRLVVGLAVVILTAIATLAGCAGQRWSRQGEFRGLEVHGKAGYACACVSDIVGIPVGVVCLPVTVPMTMIWGRTYGDAPVPDITYVCTPTVIVENVAYYIGSAITYPLYPIGRWLDERKLNRLTDEEAEQTLLADLPYLDMGKYERLIRASRRQYAPSYCAWDTAIGEESGRTSYHYPTSIFPLKHDARPPDFGRKDELDRRIAGDWKNWTTAGSPRGGRPEALGVLAYWTASNYDHIRPAVQLVLGKILSVSQANLETFARNHPEAGGLSTADPCLWKLWISFQGGLTEERDRLNREFAGQGAGGAWQEEKRQMSVLTPDGVMKSAVAYYRNFLGMDFVFVPPGKFLMGSRQGENRPFRDEGDQHSIILTRPFYLSAFEVTQEQFEKIIGTNPSPNRDPRSPVAHVTWYEAKDFCRKLSALDGRTYRLPTEAEWEYACRAGTTTLFYSGATMTSQWANCVESRAAGPVSSPSDKNKPLPVGSFSPNPWGFFDMCGNVEEYCEDGFEVDFYARSPGVDPLCEPNGKSAVARGGSYGMPCFFGRSAWRGNSDPRLGSDKVGFRIVCEAQK